ncbi:hypothetical protein ALC60_14539 [Trachymyrmex zeteki]|uniref:Uncharacterized protein n=1 Tax=Mycetomoellerius zeteki TaxID=64791 RepID=A0A151WF22_9HYME|nr:hypothetical protein ALC60_14539 [Trachymyrmex zeteki]
MIEDAAMKDERGDDVPDNESNEWEVGRERMCALESTIRRIRLQYKHAADVVMRLLSRFLCLNSWPLTGAGRMARIEPENGESSSFVDYQEVPVTMGFTHRPARKNAGMMLRLP